MFPNRHSNLPTSNRSTPYRNVAPQQAGLVQQNHNLPMWRTILLQNMPSTDAGTSEEENKSRPTSMYYGTPIIAPRLAKMEHASRRVPSNGIKVDKASPVHVLHNQQQLHNRSTSKDFNQSEILRQAASRGEVSLVGELLRARTRLDLDQEGRHAIHFAALNGHTQIVRMLLDAGVDVDIRDKLGYTALHRAAAQGHLQTVQALIISGTDVGQQDNIHGNTALHEAAWNGYSQTVDILCRAGCNCAAINKAKFTALHLASQNGHNQSARILLYAGCNPNAKNNYGDTALHTAARYGHAGVTRILISAGVITRLNEINKNGDSALHIAAALKRRKITKLLVEAGAELRLRNNQNETALDVARRKQHTEILDIIRSTEVILTQPVNLNPHIVAYGYNSTGYNKDFSHAQVMIAPDTSKLQVTSSNRPSRGIIINNNIDKIPTNSQQSLTIPKMDTNLPQSESNKIRRRGFFSLFRKKQKDKKPIEQNGNGSIAINHPPSPDTYGFGYQDTNINVKMSSTCTCGNNKFTGPCMDHGYTEYHGRVQSPINMWDTGTGPAPPGAAAWGGNDFKSSTGRLVRSRSDESLSVSEHKLKSQEERARQVAAQRKLRAPRVGLNGNTAPGGPPIQGRKPMLKEELVNFNWKHAATEIETKMADIEADYRQSPSTRERKSPPTAEFISPSHSLHFGAEKASPLMNSLAAFSLQHLSLKETLHYSDSSSEEHMNGSTLVEDTNAAIRHRAAAQQLQNWYAQFSASQKMSAPTTLRRMDTSL